MPESPEERLPSPVELVARSSSPESKVRSRADLVVFVRELQREFVDCGHAWENHTLDRFLASMASWIEDSDGAYRNAGRTIPPEGDWAFMARALGAATVYE